MTKILIVGASGRVSQLAIPLLAARPNTELSLLVRDKNRLTKTPDNANVIEGDVTDVEFMRHAVKDQDFVYINLVGDFHHLTQHVVSAMKFNHSHSHIILASALGIYDEVPGNFGEFNRQETARYLSSIRRAADEVEMSGQPYSILRLAWLTDYDEVDYEVTEKGTLFKGTEVSRKSVADLIVQIVSAPEKWQGANVGVNKPNTEGDKPAFVD